MKKKKTKKKERKKKNNTWNILTKYICKNNSRELLCFILGLQIFIYIPEYLSIPRKHSISKKPPFYVIFM